MGKKAINKRMWIIVWGVAVLLAVLGVGGFAISRGNSGREENMLQV